MPASSRHAQDLEVNGRPLRKDAELNRQRLLKAAEEVFAQRGLDATLHDVAAQAGVGVGTAYRNFTNKQQVIDALFEQRLEEVIARAQEALEDPDPWHGLTTFLEHSLRMQFEDRGLKDMLTNPNLRQDLAAASRDRIAPLIEQIVDRAREQGTLRPDFTATDLIFIQVALAALMEDSTRQIQPGLYSRYLTMLLDGMRADRPLSPLPVDSLTVDQTHTAMTPRDSTTGRGKPASQRTHAASAAIRRS